MSLKSYRDLDIWKRSCTMVTTVYSATSEFPKREMFGLTRQIRRAAVSVPSNIAEGAARLYTREYIRFLSNALGSIAELETQLIVSVDLGYTNQERIEHIFQELDQIGRMIRRLVQRSEERLATNR
ncbi:four helix bundle protein [bacterium]|nr:four helix bundle protein [bacterium]